MKVRLAALLLLVALPTLAAAAPATMSPELASQLVQIMSNDDPDAVLAQLKRLAERWRRPGDLPFILRERAALLIQAEAYDEARDELLAALAGQPPDYGTTLRYLLGQIYLLQDDAEAAVGYLEQWARHTENPGPAGLFMLGYAHLRLEQFEQAATALERTLTAAKGIRIRPRWVEVLAYVYTRLGRTDEAIVLLEGLVREHPAEARWWRQLSTVYLLLDEIGRGTAGFTIAARLEALSLEDTRRLAKLFGYLDMPADGAELLRAALEKSESPPDYEDQMLVAELLIRAREFDAAVRALETAAAGAEDGEPWLMIGQLQLQREQYRPAEAALARALIGYGEDAPALLHYLRAVTAINLDELETAAAAIRAFEDDPDMGSRAPALKTYLRSRQAAAR
jgi:predicted Zn-dependent protease